MQIVKLNFDENQVLFCPVTGKQVITPDEPFEETAATLFCYLPEYEEFAFITKNIEKEYQKIGCDFDALLKRLCERQDNYVLFQLCYPNGFESLIAFDMAFKLGAKIK